MPESPSPTCAYATSATSPGSTAARDLPAARAVPGLRQAVAQAGFTDVAVECAAFSSGSLNHLDSREIGATTLPPGAAELPVFIAVVLILAFILLLVVFRSLLIPLVAPSPRRPGGAA